MIIKELKYCSLIIKPVNPPSLLRIYIKTHSSESRGLRDEQVNYLQVAPL